jgi:hypothetical protein
MACVPIGNSGNGGAETIPYAHLLAAMAMLLAAAEEAMAVAK